MDKEMKPMDKTPIQLLEQWRKEAEELYNTFDVSSQRAYIDGCKATHEKMLKLIEKAFNVINPSAITWDYFKKENNIS